MVLWDRMKQFLSAEKQKRRREEEEASTGAAPKGGTGKVVFSGLVGSFLFLILLFFLHWPFPIALVPGIGITVALQFLTKSVERIGTTPIDRLEHGEDALALYREARKTMDEMRQWQYRITDGKLFKQADELVRVGADIFYYLTRHPEKILPSRQFLTYYLETANRIFQNYVEMQNAHLSEDKFIAIREQTAASVDYLHTIFVSQRDGYHRDAMQNLAEESELLEKTITMGGGRK